jgi:hypothetical protein
VDERNRVIMTEKERERVRALAYDFDLPERWARVIWLAAQSALRAELRGKMPELLSDPPSERKLSISEIDELNDCEG